MLYQFGNSIHPQTEDDSFLVLAEHVVTLYPIFHITVVVAGELCSRAHLSTVRIYNLLLPFAGVQCYGLTTDRRLQACPFLRFISHIGFCTGRYREMSVNKQMVPLFLKIEIHLDEDCMDLLCCQQAARDASQFQLMFSPLEGVDRSALSDGETYHP